MNTTTIPPLSPALVAVLNDCLESTRPGDWLAYQWAKRRLFDASESCEEYQLAVRAYVLAAGI